MEFSKNSSGLKRAWIVAGLGRDTTETIAENKHLAESSASSVSHGNSGFNNKSYDATRRRLASVIPESYE